MKREASVAVLFLALASSTWADSTDRDEKKPPKDAFPQVSKVQWNVAVFEDSPAFTVVKREVKGTTVTWVLENKRNLGTEVIFGYQAALFDGDGVRIKTIGIETNPSLLNLPMGERNRFILHLPAEEKWKDVRKVVITNGAYRD